MFLRGMRGRDLEAFRYEVGSRRQEVIECVPIASRTDNIETSR